MSQPPDPNFPGGGLENVPVSGPPGGAPSGWELARKRCLACGALDMMEDGHMADTGEGAKGYQRWVKGARDTSFLGGFSHIGAERRMVTALRCRECGHLVLFADQIA